MLKQQADNGAQAERKAYALHKEHAIVHTTSIDVKIMRLDKRQLTMAVFRQLPEKAIVGDSTNPSLLGVPWGRVAYLWDKSPKWADYYLVWQEGNQLYRMPMPLLKTIDDDYVCGRVRVRGCRSCSPDCWCNANAEEWEEIEGHERCLGCRRKCTAFDIDELMSRAEGFFTWLDCGDLWSWLNWPYGDDVIGDEENDGQRERACKWYLSTLEQFEQVDQLFIAT